jgi:hypothetical protein
MSPQKPVSRNSTRRTGAPKPPAFEPSAPSQTADAPIYRELPTDISSLASILEAAMKPTAKSEDEILVESDEAAEDEPVPMPSRRRTDESITVTPPSSVRAAPASPPEAAAFDEVARSLGAAEACVPLLAQSTGLLRIAALDVVKAETARAGGLLQLLRFLRGDLTPAMTAVSTTAVLQRVVQAAESERRLRGIALTSRSSVAEAMCAGDETLLVNTLLALLLATFAAIEGVQNGRVTLSLTVSDNGEIGFAVSQDHVAAPAAWLARAGSDELSADTGQALSAIALSAVHRLASTWRGRFATATGEHSSILTLWLPSGQSEGVEPTAH